MINPTTILPSDLVSRWTTACLIAAFLGGSAFIYESKKQAFLMAVLLGSVAAFEIAHAVVKFLLFSGSEDPCKIATDQTKGYAPCPDNDATENPTSMGYVGEVPINNFAILHKTSSMKTQTANVEPFHDAVNYFVTSSSKKVQALKKAPAKKKLKSSEKRAMAITRAKKSMAADKMKVEAIKKRKAADVRRV